MSELIISPNGLTIADVINVMKNPAVKVSFSKEIADNIEDAHAFIQAQMQEKSVIYGVTTGFGSLKNISIPSDKVKELQINLIRSHAIGTGEPVANDIVRSMLLLRSNCIAQGHSGVSLRNANILLDALNKNVIPYVPCQGTVGASGDLSPLSFMILALMGESQLWDPEVGSFQPSAQVMKKFNIDMLELGAKEGLALNNGTQFMTSILIKSLAMAVDVLHNANMAVALTTEMLLGTSKALDPRIHQVRPHPGQILTAAEIRNYVLPASEITNKHSKGLVQEAYSIRCVPQVHGLVHDTLQFVSNVLEKEINSANDNPLIFVRREYAEDKTTYKLVGDVVSGGNFHGQYPASAADYLGIAMATLANISERRLERLVNGSLDNRNKDGKKHIPSFAVEDAGVNSGLMILQYMAAGITAENRQLANPGSVHSIPTCENSEDHVSMGGWACRKGLTMTENTAKVVACEIYAAKMASFYVKEKTTPCLQNVLNRMPFPQMTVDRFYKPEYDQVLEMVKTNTLLEIANDREVSMTSHRQLD